MRKGFLLVMLVLATRASTAQTAGADSLILQLRAINAAVAGPSPAPGKHLLLPDRALNIFLCEAAGYYLSESDNFTLYKNSIVANTAEGSFSLYHNMREPAGVDSGIRRFLSVGAKANVADAFNAASTGRPYNNQFGFQLKITWVGRPGVTASPGQIKTMDALRAGLLHSTELDIRKKSAAEEAALDAIDPVQDIPGQDPAAARNTARQKFDADLRLQTNFDFFYAESQALHRTFNYRVVAFNWTSASIYIPLTTENFQTAPAPDAAPVDRHAYPLHLNLTHTRLWMGSRFGRIFFTLAGDLSLNNSRDGDALAKTGNLYVGDYTRFVTPAIKGQLIYIPTDSHIGISFLLQQAMGDYHALNGILGFPITLINKVEEPVADFELQVRFYDMGHSIGAGRGLSGHTAIGLTVGIPFSKIAF